MWLKIQIDAIEAKICSRRLPSSIGSTSRRSSAMGWYENAFIKRMRRQAERKRPINKLLAALTRRNSDMWSMMFIGMGLFKLGVFSAVRSYGFYVWIAVIGLLIGMPL